jgi:hypothetical protein
LEDTLVAPIFLHIRALKPADPPKKRGSYKLFCPRGAISKALAPVSP